MKINAVKKNSKNWDKKKLNHPIIAQLNINSIRNKFQFIEKEVCANLDILLISEIKLDDLFLSAQYLLDGFSKPYRLNRNSNGGGILLYIRDDVPSRILLNWNETESVFAEINFRKKKWLICASFNPHKRNISNYLHHFGKVLDSYKGNNDNVFLLGDLNSEFREYKNFENDNFRQDLKKNNYWSLILQMLHYQNLMTLCYLFLTSTLQKQKWNIYAQKIAILWLKN